MNTTPALATRMTKAVPAMRCAAACSPVSSALTRAGTRQNERGAELSLASVKAIGSRKARTG